MWIVILQFNQVVVIFQQRETKYIKSQKKEEVSFSRGKKTQKEI